MKAAVVAAAGIALALTTSMPACKPAAPEKAFTVVDTGQSACYDDAREIACPEPGAAYYGQDAQASGAQARYRRTAFGKTVYDEHTGLTWQASPDTNGDGTLSADDKLTWEEAQELPAALNADAFGGYTDWRLPSIRELYSLIDFGGTDPSGYEGTDTSGLTPFIDIRYFGFAYGYSAAGERIIDAQYASATLYIGTVMAGDQAVFGVNFADGRIKGYPTGPMPGQTEGKAFFVLCVRGNTEYGINSFVDNGDGTITDEATGLMWARDDSNAGLTWQEALAWAQDRNAASYLGYSDWRLPNAKELQSIVDYTRSPDTTGSAALDALFNATGITNEAGQADYPFYWSSTTHAGWSESPGIAAAYVAFGRALGYMDGRWLDVHGAGAQRSDPKAGDPADYPFGRGPQGDAIRIYNYARLVRNAD